MNVDLDATGVDAAGAAFEAWLRVHGLRYARHRRSALDRYGTGNGSTPLDFIVFGGPGRPNLAMIIKHERKALTETQENLLAFLAAAGWPVAAPSTPREAITETVRVVCGGVAPRVASGST